MGAGSPDDSASRHTHTTPSSYIPADRDIDFLQRDELRPLRLGLELLKPELIQTEQGIRSTIVVFGSSRLVEPSRARDALEAATAELKTAPQDPCDSSTSQGPNAGWQWLTTMISPASSATSCPPPAK